MKIRDIETKLYRIPPTIQLHDAVQSISMWEWIVTTVYTDNGLVGTGWSYTLGMGGLAIRDLIDTYLAPIVLGSDPYEIERIWTQSWLELHANGSGGFTTLAIAPLDIALHDILAKAAKVPLYRRLGGFRNRIPAYGSGINLHLAGDPLLEHIQRYLDRGYKAVKIKIGRANIEEDLERVLSVRKLIGPHVQLMLDANQRWTAADAIRYGRLFEIYHPVWLEEPVIADDLAGNARVRRGLSIPIAAGETLFTRFQFADYLRAEALDIVQADIPRVGGFTEWMKIAHMAEAHNLSMSPHFAMELSVHALCAVPNGLILEDVEGGSLTELGVLEEPYEVRNGYAAPPERPGHGVIFDPVQLKKYEVVGQVTDVQPTRHL